MRKLISTSYFPTTVFHGAGSMEKLGEACDMLQAKHIYLIASKRGLEDFKTLINAGKINPKSMDCFSDFSSEPTIIHVNNAVKELQNSKADCIVAMGGGTAIDLAKAVSVLAANHHVSLKNLHTARHLEKYPLIAIPTTSGTGSEVTKVAVITDEAQNIKYNPGHPKLVPDIAILDPELTTSMPMHVTAQTGLDALTHAMEAYVSTLASPLSDLFATEAIKLIGKWLIIAYKTPHDLEARDGMLRASCFAGLAFSNASTNLAHATARPLGTRFDLPHGLSVALTLPYTIEFGMESARDRYKQIAEALGTNDVLELVTAYNRIFNTYRLAKQKLDIDQFSASIPTLVEDALAGNGIKTNRKVPTKDDITMIYEKLAKDLEE